MDCSAIAATFLWLEAKVGHGSRLAIDWFGIGKSSRPLSANHVPAFQFTKTLLFGLLIALNRLFDDQRGWLAKSEVKADTCNS